MNCVAVTSRRQRSGGLRSGDVTIQMIPPFTMRWSRHDNNIAVNKIVMTQQYQYATMNSVVMTLYTHYEQCSDDIIYPLWTVQWWHYIPTMNSAAMALYTHYEQCNDDITYNYEQSSDDITYPLWTVQWWHDIPLWTVQWWHDIPQWTVQWWHYTATMNSAVMILHTIMNSAVMTYVPTMNSTVKTLLRTVQWMTLHAHYEHCCDDINTMNSAVMALPLWTVQWMAYMSLWTVQWITYMPLWTLLWWHCKHNYPHIEFCVITVLLRVRTSTLWPLCWRNHGKLSTPAL